MGCFVLTCHQLANFHDTGIIKVCTMTKNGVENAILHSKRGRIHIFDAYYVFCVPRLRHPMGCRTYKEIYIYTYIYTYIDICIYTVRCKINSKKRWGGFNTRPLFRFIPSAYFYLVNIATTRQVKKLRRSNSLKKKRNKSKSGQNWQNPWIFTAKLTSSST